MQIGSSVKAFIIAAALIAGAALLAYLLGHLY
jgi:hypothetical protein